MKAEKTLKEQLMFGVPEHHSYWVSRKIDEALSSSEQKIKELQDRIECLSESSYWCMFQSSQNEVADLKRKTAKLIKAVSELKTNEWVEELGNDFNSGFDCGWEELKKKVLELITEKD
jgi:prefoldin subunit 5